MLCFYFNFLEESSFDKVKKRRKKKGKKPRNQPKNETKTNNCLWGKKIKILGKKNSLRSSCRALLPSYGSCLWSSKETSPGRFSPGELCSCSESATSAAEFVQRNVRSCFKAGLSASRNVLLQQRHLGVVPRDNAAVRRSVTAP